MLYIILFIVIILLGYIFLLYKSGSADPRLADISDLSIFKPDFKPHYSRLLTVTKEKTRQTRPLFTRLSVKLGQTKLALTELEFYTLKGKEVDIVIYAGAAPGHHQRAIAPMFPNWKFILYDPRDFAPELYTTSNLELHQEFFTEDTARKLHKQYGSHSVLFLSDIRTDIDADIVIENMEQQRQWCKILKPRWAMLKFRLEWEPVVPVKYFVGDIYPQPYIGPTSEETRLITNCKKEKNYDRIDYRDKVYYFNKNVRPAFHEYELPNINGIDHCYDCWAATHIIKEFIASKFAKSSDTVESVFNTILDSTKQTLNAPPHGVFPEERDIWAKMLNLQNISEEYDSKLKSKLNNFKK